MIAAKDTGVAEKPIVRNSCDPFEFFLRGWSLQMYEAMIDEWDSALIRIRMGLS